MIIKTALRNLWKNRTYGFLNIFGLAVGIACAALIFLWVEDELNFNHHHKDLDRIARIMEHQTYDGQTFTFGASPGPLAQGMQNEIPGIQYVARTNWGDRKLFSLDDKVIYEQGLYMDSSFFKIFDFPFVKGDPVKPFSQLNSIIVSQAMAEKFFGDVNTAYGKSLKMDNEQEYVISGIFKDLPLNSSFKFDWAAPFRLFEEKNTWLSGWGSNGVQTFVRLTPNADINKINKQLSGYIQSKKSDAIAKAFLFPITDWRLRSKFVDGKQVGGRIEYVRLFTIIAWIILIIACINFMNLATARSEQRAREVGVRKVLGARKNSLVRQFLTESVIMAFISVLLSIGIVYISLGGFNTIVDKELSLDLTRPVHIVSLIVIGLICGLVAGSYPSLYLSSFSPVTVFKGLRIKGSTSAGLIRKGLVVAQFAISIVLIIATIIIYEQVQHVKQRNLGYDKNNMIYLDLQGKMNEHFPAIRQQLLATGVVENAAVANERLLSIGNNGDDYSWKGKDPNSHILITNEWVSSEYVKTMGMKLKSGRDFGPVPENDSTNIIVNESFAKLMKKNDVVGEMVKANGLNAQIIGVVSDFVYSDMYGPSAPLVLFCQPRAVNYLFVRFKAGTDIQAGLSKLEAVLKSNNPGYPFEYKFLDDEFNKLFKSETLIGRLSRIFAFLAIFISCLGLFGLAAYTAERRRKEIGIRKVLGASIGNITTLISKDFLKLVLISFVIAFPLAWYYMNKWLEDFAYRIDISWVVFAGAGLIALLIALLTISFQAIRAAVANPVKSLRSE
ncbi:MAG: ABC transporter permease [Flavisolibacter sp.]